MRWLARLVWAIVTLVGVAAIAVGAWLFFSGIGTRTPPGSLESAVARTARRAMIPAAARSRASAMPATAETTRDGMEHWADHCAVCHANDGSGVTDIGQGLYPRAPDMRLPSTQDLTDGELFYIIENGVKLTGMPAWGNGTPEGEASSWHLVHFVRKLPTLSEEELTEMEGLNPRGPDAWRSLEEERRFLAGEGTTPPTTPSHKH